MEKKNYSKPDAEVINVYSNEEIAALGDPDYASKVTFELVERINGWS